MHEDIILEPIETSWKHLLGVAMLAIPAVALVIGLLLTAFMISASATLATFGVFTYVGIALWLTSE